MLHSNIMCITKSDFDNLKNMGECPAEQGGYFIIDGKEKVNCLLMREKQRINYMFKKLKMNIIVTQ